MKDIYIGSDKIFDLLLLDDTGEVIPKTEFTNIICHLYLQSSNTKLASYVLNSSEDTIDYLPIQEGDNGLFITLEGSNTIGTRANDTLMIEAHLYIPNQVFEDGDKLEIMRASLGVLKKSFKD